MFFILLHLCIKNQVKTNYSLSITKKEFSLIWIINLSENFLFLRLEFYLKIL
jgi:hypothetical protein